MILPDHLFVGTDGALYDTRRADWSASPLRAGYDRHYRHIANTSQLRATLRADQYAWPGGYRLYFVTSDGACLCFNCVKQEYWQVSNSVRNRFTDGWRVTGVDSVEMADGEPVTCDHCNCDLTEG